MNVTTDYGIRAVLYLAQKNCTVSSNLICKDMKIPHTYMHKIARTLKGAGIIEEVRGSTGGFKLKEEPRNITLLNIIKAFEKTMNINRCLEEDKFCSRNATALCAIRGIYLNAQTELYNRLDLKVSTFLSP